MNKLFIFDMGDVILLDVAMLEQIADYVGIDYCDLKNDYSIYERALSDGYMTPDDYYHHLEDKYQCSVKEDLFLRFFHPYVNGFMLQIVDRLRADGYRCVIGSNTCQPHWEHCLSAYSEKPLYHFDALYASHLIHMSKPESAFWRIICSKEGYDYSDVIFIDDTKENVEAANALGIRTLLYSGEDKNERAIAFFSEFV